MRKIVRILMREKRSGEAKGNLWEENETESRIRDSWNRRSSRPRDAEKEKKAALREHV
jgi:hypothetical protein